MSVGIELDEVRHRYDGVQAVDGVSLSIAPGEVVALLGGSGSGKTTALKTINRLIEPTSGRVLLDGRDVASVPAHELRRGIGYVFQGLGLFPHMSVAENVGIVPRLLDWEPGRIRDRVDELLALVELDVGIANRPSTALSGGQQQRVGVARALAAAPPVMLLDEPFGALDPLTRRKLQTAFTRIRRQLRLTAVFVTHDIVEAVAVADRIAILGSGKLVQVGTPTEVFSAPADDTVAGFVRSAREHLELLGPIAGVPS